MKLERKGTDVKITGADSAPQAFRINSSSIAFTILSSKLYQDKILACIRELSCNAWDAHVMAGKKDVPFEIHLPTSFEPWFAVKDYGVGLNPAAPFIFEITTNERTGQDYEVRVGKFNGQKLADNQTVKPVDELIDLYCTYFSSNKDQSNEVVGAMGLGSKSPFCYTEGFTVTSRFDGVTRIATAFINKQGTPDVSIQTTEETPDVCNGLEVMFPVKQTDVWEFNNKAKIALEFFTPAPVLNAKCEIDKQIYAVKTAKWGTRTNAQTHHTNKIRAIQGNVQYSVGNIDESRMTADQQQIAQMPLDLFFPIGSLAVAASRETLSNDERTVANILGMLDDIYSGMLDEVKKKLNECKHPWDARLLVFQMTVAPGMGKIVNEAWNKGELFGKYDNFKLEGKKPSINEFDYDHVMMYRFSRNWRAGRWATKQLVFKNQTARQQALASIASKSHNKNDFDMEIDVEKDDKVAFIVNDLKFGGEKYIHYFLQEADDNTQKQEGQGRKTVAYLFSRADKNMTTAQVVKDAEKILEKLGNPPYEMLSALKDRYKAICDVRDKQPTQPREVRNILEFNPNGNFERGYYTKKGWQQVWKKAEETLPAGPKFYVGVDSLKATETGFEYAEDLVSFFNSAKKAGIFGVTGNLYALKLKDEKRKDAEWIDLVPFVLSQVKMQMTPAKEMEMTLLFKDFTCDYDETLQKIAQHSPLDDDSPMQLFCNSLAAARKNTKDATFPALKAICDVAKTRKIYTPGPVVDFAKSFETVKKGYPMLHFVGRSYYYSGNVSMYRTLTEYFNHVDAARKVTAPALKLATAVPQDGEGMED